MKKLILTIFTLNILLANAQNESDLVQWKMTLKETGQEDMKDVHIKAKIDKGWQLYSNDFDPNLGPLVTEFNYVQNEDYELMRGTIPQDSKRKYDEVWDGEYSYFENSGLWIQTIKTTKKDPNVECKITYQVCNTADGKCIPFEKVLIPTSTEE